MPTHTTHLRARVRDQYQPGADVRGTQSAYSTALTTRRSVLRASAVSRRITWGVLGVPPTDRCELLKQRQKECLLNMQSVFSLFENHRLG